MTLDPAIEARVKSKRALMFEQDRDVLALLDEVERLRDALADEHAGRCADQLDLAGALAALAEMRAGIVLVVQHQANHRIPMPMAYIDDLLSRTDLGAGVVVVPREVVEEMKGACADATLSHDMCTGCRWCKLYGILDALLKKGGG